MFSRRTSILYEHGPCIIGRIAKQATSLDDDNRCDLLWRALLAQFAMALIWVANDVTQAGSVIAVVWVGGMHRHFRWNGLFAVTVPALPRKQCKRMS